MGPLGGGEVVLCPGRHLASTVVRRGPGGLESVASDLELLEYLCVVPKELLPGAIAEVRRCGGRGAPAPATESADIPVQGTEEGAGEMRD